VKIVPTVQTSTDHFRALTLDKRGCRLNAEIMEDSIFKYYTQKTCMFECTLKNIIPNIVSASNLQFIVHIQIQYIMFSFR
jgi:hypothetical protein